MHLKSLEERMADYAAYHQNRYNRLTHVIGVPMVVFSVFLLLAWFRFVYRPFPISAAIVFYVFVVAYYLRLDIVLGVLQFPLTLALLSLAEYVARLEFAESLSWFLCAFIGGWIFQLTGHVFEGRRPALLDNISQALNAPLFLICEGLFLLGWRADLQKRIHKRVGLRCI